MCARVCTYIYMYVCICLYTYTQIDTVLVWYRRHGNLWADVSWLNLGNPFEKDKDDKLITVPQVLGSLWGSPEP